MDLAPIGDSHFVGCAIPVEQITETRVQFQHAEIHYEVQFDVSNPWLGLQACAAVFQESGLQCVSIRYSKGGTVFLRLKDTGKGELKRVEANLRQHRDVRLQSWITVVSMS